MTDFQATSADPVRGIVSRAAPNSKPVNPLSVMTSSSDLP